MTHSQKSDSSRGFFTIAQGKEYQRMAYALALSLKISQPKISNLSIGVTKLEKRKIPEKYLQVFDEVVEIPWKDHAAKSSWKLENEWKSIHMTPYDNTIKLDADMLFFDDISGWWEVLEKSEGVFATDVLSYRNEKVVSDYYRKTFTESKLPNVYSAFFFFKKSDINFEFFKLSELIFNNWERFSNEFLEPIHRPLALSTDVIFGIVAKILDYEQYNLSKIDLFPTFVHMKSRLQSWYIEEDFDEDWTKMIPVYYTPEHSCKIGNYRQTYPLHYFVKSFLTNEMISFMEKKLGI